MHMLWLSLAGLMGMFVIFLSPSALHPGQAPRESDLIHCQSSVPFPSLAAARREQRSTVPAVPARRHARAGLYHPVGRPSTWGYYPVPDQLPQVLPYGVRKCSFFWKSWSYFPDYSQVTFQAISESAEARCKWLALIDDTGCLCFHFIPAFLMCRDVFRSRKFWNRIQVSPGLLSLKCLQKSSGSCSFVCTSCCTHNLSPIYI